MKRRLRGSSQDPPYALSRNASATAAVVVVALSCLWSTTRAFHMPSTSRPFSRSLHRSVARIRPQVSSLMAKRDAPGGGDVLVIGGGLAGLSTALELSQRGAKVVVVSRDEAESASMAAGGMLAPQAERLEAGPYLDLCLQSRDMYSEWAADLEQWSGGISTGFAAAGGFLAPAFTGDQVDGWVPPPGAGPAYRLDGPQIRGMEPALSPHVTGGWWYPEDMQVDARRLFRALREACLRAGVSVLEGSEWAVEALVFHPALPAVQAVKMSDGRRLSLAQVVVANGAWMNRLLPVPVGPVKGQMLSLRPKKGEPNPLTRVIFAENCYLIPKADGRLIVGATVEAGQWDRGVTAKGIHDLTQRALQICPALGNLELEETWAGLRPTTPDTLPVLGSTPWENLFVAGGYWRNGVLLAPRTGQLVADCVEGKVGADDAALLSHFAWSRFLPYRVGEARQGSRKSAATVAADATVGDKGSAESMSLSKPPRGATSPAADTSAGGPTPSSPTAPADTVTHHDDPYADYAQLKAAGNVEDTEAIIREARRVNREGLVGYGLGEDAVGRETASKFNVPSAGMGQEWSSFEAAAEQGVHDMGRFDVDYLKDDSHLNREALSIGPDAVHHDTRKDVGQGMEREEGEESIETFVARHGYEYENPREARAREKEMRRQMTQMGMVPPPPTSEALGGKGKRETEGDAYEEYYSSEEREQVGWEVVRQMEKEEEKRCEHGLVKAQGTHRNDPYADYAQLKAAGNVEDTEAIIREARRVNREGLVGYGLGEDAVGRETASKFNVPSAGMGQEWSSFEAAAEQGIQDMGRYQDIGGGASSQKGSGSTLEAEEEMGIEEFMARLGYEYADPRVAKSQGEVESRPVDDPTSSSTESSFQSLAAPSTSVGNAFPRPQTIAPPAASPDASPSPFNTIQPLPPRADQSPPPWAHEIEALYDRVRANQAAARRRQGLPPLPGDADVMLPFIHPPGDQPLDPQGRPRQLTTEEVLSKLEMVRVNPDGSFTKVEAGQGLPAPWEPPTASAVVGGGGFETLPRPVGGGGSGSTSASNSPGGGAK